MINEQAWKELHQIFTAKKITLVAVSKTKPAADIRALYDLGQKDFGENYVQELADKQKELPTDIQWHFIGHLQSNKVKIIAPFVHLIHAVDSHKLLQEINKQAARNNRVIDVLLQYFIADEETKFGLTEKEIIELLDYYEAQQTSLQHIRICGLMGMASFTDDEEKISNEFKLLKNLHVYLKQTYFLQKNYFNICSMGMSSDYNIALEEGSNMVRIGSMLFGNRS